MGKKECYTEVYIDNFDNIIEQYRVYGDGIIIALIDNNGYISYNYNNAKECINTQKVISLFIEKLKKKQKNIQYYLEY